MYAHQPQHKKEASCHLMNGLGPREDTTKTEVENLLKKKSRKENLGIGGAITGLWHKFSASSTLRIFLLVLGVTN